jgi:cold shock protein
MKGKVKWFDDTKGFGFLLSDEGQEFFVHWKSIVTMSERERKFLTQDENVEFDTMETDKGTQAINVVKL